MATGQGQSDGVVTGRGCSEGGWYVGEGCNGWKSITLSPNPPDGTWIMSSHPEGHLEPQMVHAESDIASAERTCASEVKVLELVQTDEPDKMISTL